MTSLSSRVRRWHILLAVCISVAVVCVMSAIPEKQAPIPARSQSTYPAIGIVNRTSRTFADSIVPGASNVSTCQRINPWAHSVEEYLAPFAGGISQGLIEEAASFMARSKTQFGSRRMEGWRVLLHEGEVYALPFGKQSSPQAGTHSLMWT